MKNWGWVTTFQHVKKGERGKIMHCIRGGSWLKTTNVSEISVMYLCVSK